MAWYDEACFYHIYPLGAVGAPKQNNYGEPVPRLRKLFPWIDHLKRMGFNALYIGPLFESVGHGYETTDYYKLDSRLGTNEDLKEFVNACHRAGIRVIFDGVFNHTGRDFFAFRDIREKREASAYRDWYCNVNFWGNNEYNDGFSYDNWGGYNLLVKLNQKNPAVKDYICDVIRFWVSEFDVDGIRLDAADVLDFDFMKALRATANRVKPEFWLMGEVIHGDYNRWVNEGTLHSVTNYHLHKALYSGHNDHNYFEIAHTVKRLYGMGGNKPDGLKLYNFVDNHDVERIYTKLSNKAHFTPVHVLLFTLPGIPSVYYGSEFGMEGKKERGSDDSLRPAIEIADYEKAPEENGCTALIRRLCRVRGLVPALSYGGYRELMLTNRQYAFVREFGGQSVLIAVNNDDNPASFDLPAGGVNAFVGALSGECFSAEYGVIHVQLPAAGGEIFVPEGNLSDEKLAEGENLLESAPFIERETNPEEQKQEEQNPEEQNQEEQKQEEQDTEPQSTEPQNTEPQSAEPQNTEPAASSEIRTHQAKERSAKSYEEMTIEELQEEILEKMSKNGPVTDQMLRTVRENVYHNSLINWVKSFRS